MHCTTDLQQTAGSTSMEWTQVGKNVCKMTTKVK